MTENQPTLVKIEFTYTVADVAKFNFFALKRKLVTRLLFLVLKIMNLIYFPLLMLSIMLYGDMSKEWPTFLLIAASPLSYLLYFLYFRYFRFKKAYDPRFNGDISKEIYIFREDGFTGITESKAERTETSSTYEGCAEAYETKAYFYLFNTKNSAYILPKRAIVEGSSERLSQLLQTRFGKLFHKSKTL